MKRVIGFAIAVATLALVVTIGIALAKGKRDDEMKEAGRKAVPAVVFAGFAGAAIGGVTSRKSKPK